MPNVQPFYNEYLAPAVIGMRANMEPARVISRVCMPSFMPMGIVAVHGTMDDQASNVASGGTYLGIVGLDPTTRPVYNETIRDQYVQGDIMNIYTKGVIWVRAMTAVTPGVAAYFDGNGNLSSTTGAGKAFGYVTFTDNPQPGQTISIAGTTVTFEASGATGNQVNVGESTHDTVAALLAMLTASADTNLVKATYDLDTNGTTLNVFAATGGTAGNALTLATNVPNATVSGPTLSGGTAGNTAIPNAVFDSTAAAGGLVKLRLN